MNLEKLYYELDKGNDFPEVTAAFEEVEEKLKSNSDVADVLMSVYKLASKEQLQGFIKGCKFIYGIIKELS